MKDRSKCSGFSDLDHAPPRCDCNRAATNAASISKIFQPAGIPEPMMSRARALAGRGGGGDKRQTTSEECRCSEPPQSLVPQGYLNNANSEECLSDDGDETSSRFECQRAPARRDRHVLTLSKLSSDPTPSASGCLIYTPKQSKYYQSFYAGDFFGDANNYSAKEWEEAVYTGHRRASLWVMNALFYMHYMMNASDETRKNQWNQFGKKLIEHDYPNSPLGWPRDGLFYCFGSYSFDKVYFIYKTLLTMATSYVTGYSPTGRQINFTCRWQYSPYFAGPETAETKVVKERLAKCTLNATVKNRKGIADIYLCTKFPSKSLTYRWTSILHEMWHAGTTGLKHLCFDKCSVPSTNCPNLGRACDGSADPMVLRQYGYNDIIQTNVVSYDWFLYGVAEMLTQGYCYPRTEVEY